MTQGNAAAGHICRARSGGKGRMKAMMFVAAIVTFGYHTALGQGVRNYDEPEQSPKGAALNTSAADEYISLYQKYISAARGSRCAMFPSCSNYGLTVFRNYPFVVAMAMTADRMIRCGHDGQYYDLTYEYGYASLIDLPSSYRPDPHLAYKPKGYVTTDNRKALNEEDSITGFVRHLINRHDYQLALLEIERISYFKPSLDGASLFLQRLLCYDGLDREEEGIMAYHDLKDSGISSDASVLFQAARMYGELGNYREEINLLATINTRNEDTLYNCEVRKAAASLRLDEEDEAATYIKASRVYAPSMERHQQNLEILRRLETTGKKSPLAAGLLSVIPGGGYVYDKQPASALTAFLVNGVLAFATASSFHKENYGVATVMTIFSLTFYTGNILGSVNGAKKYNKKRVEDAARSLEKTNYIY